MSILDPFLDMFARLRSNPPPPPGHLSRAELVKIYGDPGHGADADPKWRKANIVTVRDLPGIPSRFYFMTHRLIVDRLRATLTAAAEAAPDYQIERAASFVFRHQRHDDTRPLSLHSYGIAIDVDSDKNASRTFKRGGKPAPFSARWTALWPDGLPPAFVEAFERAGWTWGGRWDPFVDPMHFEYTRRP